MFTDYFDQIIEQFQELIIEILDLAYNLWRFHVIRWSTRTIHKL